MHKKHKLLPIAAAMTALAGVATPSIHAQSADAIIDKLVDKGILTQKEAKDLREEADKGFTQAYQSKSGMPDWVTSFRLNGDMRGRYDGIFVPDLEPGNPGLNTGTVADRHRFRYRLRFGAVATLKDNFEVGFRLTSSDAVSSGGGVGEGDPISGNTSFQNNGSKKLIFVDQAYARWTAVNTPDFMAVGTIGKMENPFVFSEMVFDSDYTPEGAALNLTYNLSDTHVLKFNGGGFMLDEIGANANDPYLLGAQLRWDATWTPKISSSLGASILSIVNAKEGLASGAVPDQNGGNERSGATAGPGNPIALALQNAYSTFVIDAGATYNLESFPFYTGVFPISIRGEYMENLAAPDRKQGYAMGVTFGKSGKKKTWDVSYKYKELQGDAWYEELVDSDFGGFYQVADARYAIGANSYRAGTNLRGHMIRGQYSFYDSFTLGATVFMAEAIDTAGSAAVPATYDSQAIRLQVDAVWKF